MTENVTTSWFVYHFSFIFYNNFNLSGFNKPIYYLHKEEN